MQICLQDCSVHYTGAIFSVSLRLTLWSHIWQNIDAFVTEISIVVIEKQIIGAGVVLFALFVIRLNCRCQQVKALNDC